MSPALAQLPATLPARQRRPHRALGARACAAPPARVGHVSRTTKETSVSVTLNLDGTGKCSAASGIPFLDHMLDVRARCVARAAAGLAQARRACAEGALRSKSPATACWTSQWPPAGTSTSTTTTRTRTLRSPLAPPLRRRWATGQGSAALGTSPRRWTRHWCTWCWCAGLAVWGACVGKLLARWAGATSADSCSVLFLRQDLSGRPHCAFDCDIPTERVGTYDTQLVRRRRESSRV